MDANQLKEMLQHHAGTMAEDVARDLGRGLQAAGPIVGALKVKAEVTVKFTLDVPLLPDPSVTFHGVFSVRPTAAGPAVEGGEMSVVPSIA